VSPGPAARGGGGAVVVAAASGSDRCGARGLYLHQPEGAMLRVARGEVEPLEQRRLEAILHAPPLAAEGPAPYDEGR
jgi:hypothetical protein